MSAPYACEYTVIPKSRIPVKSPDTSPMDFFDFGFLKQRCEGRHVKTLKGLWKVLCEVWSSVPQKMTKNVFAAWKRRLRSVSALNGLHIEQTKTIHRRKLTL